jgi:hypothetical protein
MEGRATRWAGDPQGETSDVRGPLRAPANLLNKALQPGWISRLGGDDATLLERQAVSVVKDVSRDRVLREDLAGGVEYEHAHRQPVIDERKLDVASLVRHRQRLKTKEIDRPGLLAPLR